jgi:drug/metabolite transporter (DMT)-like permease
MPEPSRDEIRTRLWNDTTINPGSYATDADFRYLSAVLEQYKIYVEMADRISARRALTNTFFLTLNTLVLTVFGFFWRDRPTTIPLLAAILGLLVLLGQAIVWWLILLSYRQLNSGKYKVVGLLEERLPASPYWSAEWKALGEGESIKQYFPLTHVEQWVPVLFAVVYILGFVLVVTTP